MGRASNDGVTIAWERRGPEDGDTPLVLVHGLGYARWGWEPVVERLAARRPVVMLDNRGIGASDVPPGPYTAAQMAGDVTAVMDAAGIDRAHVLGASPGGMIAQELALAHPERVDHLVLCCTTPGGHGGPPDAGGHDEAARGHAGDGAGRGPAGSRRQRPRGARGGRAPPVGRTHRRAPPRYPAGPGRLAGPGPRGTTFDAGERVTDIEQPTLVVHGTADAVVDVRDSAVLAGLVPHARVELVAGGGHLFFWEDPARLVALVDDFLP